MAGYGRCGPAARLVADADRIVVTVRSPVVPGRRYRGVRRPRRHGPLQSGRVVPVDVQQGRRLASRVAGVANDDDLRVIVREQRHALLGEEAREPDVHRSGDMTDLVLRGLPDAQDERIVGWIAVVEVIVQRCGRYGCRLSSGEVVVERRAEDVEDGAGDRSLGLAAAVGVAALGRCVPVIVRLAPVPCLRA